MTALDHAANDGEWVIDWQTEKNITRKTVFRTRETQ